MAACVGSGKRKHVFKNKSTDNEEEEDSVGDLLVSVNNEDGDSTDSEGNYEEEDDDENGDDLVHVNESSDESDKEDPPSDESEEESENEIVAEESSDEEEEESSEVNVRINNINNKDTNINTKGKETDSSRKKKIKSASIKTQNSNEDVQNGNTNKPNSSDVQDEYKEDSSDEEDIRNTVGNVPMNWYDEYPHLGYDWDGKKIMKPPKRDELDEFLKRMEDPDYWRTVKDPQTGQDVVLSEADCNLIERLQSGKFPDAEYDQYAPWIEWFTSEVMEMPLRKFPEHKRSFLPSRVEKEKVARMVHAIKMGWIKPKPPKEEGKKFYMLWEKDDQAEELRRIENHIPAPKKRLPGHAESYNPPTEYLFDDIEMKQWKRHESEPWKRKRSFLPQKYGSLREVPAYAKYVKEQFERCLDLYLCPRGRRMRLDIRAEDLLPELPNPKDLQPFPTVLAMVYEGHTDMVRTITVDPLGQYLASGSDDGILKVWEVQTGRCLRNISVGGVIRCVAWCPNSAISLIAICTDKQVLLLNPAIGDHLVISRTDDILQEPPTESEVVVPERVKDAVKWEQAEGDMWDKGVRVIVNHFKEVRQVCWHGKGDYFATVIPEGQNRAVMIHQLSKRRSQIPFTKAKGLVQCVLFHPIKPFLFVATQRHVRIYDLVKQELFKKLMTSSKWVSSMAIHPGGDNLLVGTYDRKVLWFDLDLSTEPYQTLRLHGTAVRGVAFHKRYPLFATGSDDRSVIVCHGMVYNDLLQNPLIVPLKRLRGHEEANDFGVFSVLFHPTQPWLFSSGADKTIRLYT